MSKTPSLFATSFEDTISDIALLPGDVFNEFRNEIRGARAFDNSDERIAQLAEKLRTSNNEAEALLEAAAILYEHVQALPEGSSTKDVIGQFIDQFDEVPAPQQRETLIARLVELTSQNEAAEINKKIRRLQAGFLDTAHSFATFVDLRPDFTKERDQVRAFVPMIQFKVSTDSENPHNQELVFQLDEQGLARLKEEIKGVERKLATLSEQRTTTIPILFRAMRK
jgi:hypothetical protein